MRLNVDALKKVREASDVDDYSVACWKRFALGLRLGPTDSSERAHWMEMLRDLKQPAMFVGDAGFVGYEYAAAVFAASHQLLIRVGSHVTLLKQLGYARESGDTVYYC